MYPMWTQNWPLEELQSEIDTRKLISENNGIHPLSFSAVLYLPRDKGGRGRKSVEQYYKLIKIKAATKLHENPDLTMRGVRIFEGKACEKGFSSLVKDAYKFAEEMATSLNLATPDPSCSSQ